MSRLMKDSGVEWIGLIPDTWKLIRGKYLFTERNERGNKKELQLLSPTQRYGVVPQEVYEELSGMKAVKLEDSIDLASLKSIYVGDYCISLRSFQGGFEYSKYNGVVSPAYHVFHKTKLLDDGYYRYLFKDRSFIDKMASLTKTFRDGKSIAFVDFSGSFIPFPPVEEQRRIASFLNHKCEEINGVIAETEKTIEEYKALKQSIITETVTKGVRGKRTMKYSGIEWVGQIPSEWDVVRIKTLFDYRNERNNKPLEEVNLISLYTDKGVVQHCDLEETTGNKASNADGYKLVYQDDIVVNIILCWMGAIGRSSYSGVTSPAYDVYSPKPKTNSEFYHYYFRTSGFSGDCYKYGRGIMAMRWRTYSDEFRALQVVCPSVEEQDEIVAYLDEKCKAIEKLIENKQKLLAELESYKKSVIYEYVTGKKEVTV